MGKSLFSSSVGVTAALFACTSLVIGCGDDSGAGGQLDPLVIDAPANEWTWVEFPDSSCMDGTPTGIGINPHATSDDVVIFMMGGYACFNPTSCTFVAHKDGYSSAEFGDEKTEVIDQRYMFDRDNPDNPFRDFSYVFVPYCSGDAYTGDKADVEVAGDTYQFHGYRNLTQFLERVVPTFPEAARVVLMGESAGGFGAFYNYDHVASAFGPDVKVTLIDDAGPPMSEEFVPECLQQIFIDTWGAGQTLPSGCSDCDVEGVWLEPYVDYLLATYPDRSLGVISSEADATISSFWSFGNDDCAGIDDPPGEYAPEKYKAGLEDLRDRIAGDDGRLRLFMIPGDEHVFSDNGLGVVNIEGVSMEEWIQQALDEDPAWPNVSASPPR